MLTPRISSTRATVSQSIRHSVFSRRCTSRRAISRSIAIFDLGAFVHLGDGTTRMKDLPTSVVALLVSEACNIGLAPVVNPGYEALPRARLVHVNQYYLRADTIAAANARLIAAQAAVSIVKFRGDGLLASVDGLRFVVPVRTVSAAPSPKYFGFKRGITWLNAVDDQVAGIGQTVVPGTPRDLLHILDALLNLDGGVKPEMVANDNASYSDKVFGLFKILGYNFSPRFRDLEDQRFWRATMPGVETGTYGAVEDQARNRVNLNKVITQWPEMLKVAGSLLTNTHPAAPRRFSSSTTPATSPPNSAGPASRRSSTSEAVGAVGVDP